MCVDTNQKSRYINDESIFLLHIIPVVAKYRVSTEKGKLKPSHVTDYDTTGMQHTRTRGARL